MRLAAWNVNGLRARLDFVLGWLRSRQPDVVGLQELKLEDDQFPLALFEAEGYHALTHGQKAWNGVAVLSRERAELVQRGLPGQEDFGSRLITARLGDLSFTTLYAPNSKSVEHADFPRKLAWFEALAAHLGDTGASGGPALVCGDFNICPAPIDSWNEDGFRERIFHTSAERERLAAVLNAGFADSFRSLHPDEQKFSWWDYRGGAFHRKQGLRIDLCLASPKLMERAREAWIDREYRKKQDGLTASDHAPVVVDVD